ncbi:Hypothetical predicted protein [Mytilus galloprovincialis]|uniref:Endonuclease/exonuclease/phosphatase domain-containing protein n=1 Tax=Mytilus galloprovincialis TaxID=29158 RepID=A0A8B6BFQ5_MYTGA|nr:Hypothetical predicted protein [Mytilus galloprovincialis]
MVGAQEDVRLGISCVSNISQPVTKYNNRHFGGLAILRKPSLKQHVKILKSSIPDFQWVKLEKQFFGFDKDLFICVVYNPPEGSSYSKGLDHDILTCLEKDIASYQKQGNILLCGDFNARVASDTDFIIDDSNNLSPLYQSYFSDKQILERRSKDDKLDSRGRDLLDLCISNQIRILNGRVLGDTFGGLTCYTPNGASTVDYVLVSESILNQILYMRICNFIPTLSDCHCLLEWSLSAKYCLKTDCDSVKTHKMSPGFIWSDDSPALFQDALFTAEIQQRLDKFLKLEPIDSQNAIDSASLELTDIIITAANISLKRRKAQTGKGVKHQKWFDCNLAYLRKKTYLVMGKFILDFPEILLKVTFINYSAYILRHGNTNTGSTSSLC